MSDGNAKGFGPWPIQGSGMERVQSVRYCFKDDRSHKNLEGIVKKAVVNWEPAMVRLDASSH